MPKIIKIKCNGPGQHENEVDLDKVVKTNVVLKKTVSDSKGAPEISIPERLVLPCKECVEGKVILTRSMIEPYFSS